MNENNHSRRSIRLPEYDYSSPGAYFIKIVTHNRKCLFGDIKDGDFFPNLAAEMVDHWWLEMEKKFSSIAIDEYCLMPNHFHGIITIIDKRHNQNMETNPVSLSRMIQWFKTMTTNSYIQKVKNFNWEPFTEKLWQRNYYEHIIRSEDELSLIRRYIDENPIKWDLDDENPVEGSNADSIP